MGTVMILPETTANPITLIGERAGVCCGADTSNSEKNYQRGMDCIDSGHGRVLEFVNVEMVLDGYSARVMREWYTHIGGAPTRLQASTRYINYGEFEYVVPPSIMKNPTAFDLYTATMKTIGQMIKQLEDMDMPVPREDAALLLPLGMTTRVVDKRNLRNLVDMSRQRLCNRAYWEFQQLMDDICDALEAYSEEWAWVVNTQFYPKCEAVGYCTEKRGCGRMAKKG